MDHSRIEEHNLIDRYVRGTLPADERAEFEEHFVDCAACQEQIEAAKSLRLAVRESVTETRASSGWRWTAIAACACLGIARSLVVEHFRRTARLKERHEGEPDRQLPSPEPSQLDQLLRHERAALARRVLSELPSDRDRKILYRFYLEDDEKENICADFGISALHFNHVISRARQRYKKIYESMGDVRKK